jgi:hypothetical protein
VHHPDTPRGNHADDNAGNRDGSTPLLPDEELIALATALCLGDGDLDELVHEVVSRAGSAINNSGIAGQVTYLLDQFGPAETERQIRAAAPPRHNPVAKGCR